MTAAPLLEVRDLEAGYGGLQVLHQVSAVIRPGTITCIIGPLAAGISTSMVFCSISPARSRWRNFSRVFSLSSSSATTI